MSADKLIALDRRVRSNGFGKVVLGAFQPTHGMFAVITVPAQTDQERDDISQFLQRLMTDFEFRYKRDVAEFTYEHGRLSNARITFGA